MSSEKSMPTKPRFRTPAICGKRGCRCRQRVLLCFGIPLLPPSAALLGVAYGTNLTFGVFHILGFVLTALSVSCITAAVIITLYKRMTSTQDPKKVGNDNQTEQNIPRPRSSSNSSSSSSIKLVKIVKIHETSLTTEVETKQNGIKGKRKKRKHRKSRTKLPPVKEEDGRSRFEQSMAERERAGKRLHKRTKSESRKGFEECIAKMQPSNPSALTKKHLKLLGMDNLGSQDSLQLKRSVSMSDLGDSASERLSVDFPESPKVKRPDQGDSGSVTARPVLIHTSASRSGVRTSRFSAVL